MTSMCRKVLSLVILVAGGGARMFAQGADCDNGIVRMNDGTTGRLTVCSKIADQVPALARQLSELSKVIVVQNSQLADMQKLVRSVNNVGRTLGVARQTQLLENIAARLQAGQDAGSTHLKSRVTTLADDFEDTQDQMLTLLSDPATAPKATAALQGPTGDAIARLDFSTVHSQLEDIRAQLRQLNSKVDEVNTKTGNIEKIMEASRISAANVQNALMGADMQVLQLVVSSSNSAKVVEEAFRQKADGGKSTVARHFFSASAQSPQALQWFDAQLAAGLDPNMTVPGDAYPAEAILIEAMRAGNVRAMELLLQHGASPHPYQNLPYTPWVRARFVFPLSAIAADDRFSVADKQRLARAFLTAGAVVPAAEKAGAFSGEVFYVVQELQQKVAGELGMPLTLTPTLCQQPQTAICKTASTRDKRDWCGIVRTMPRMIQVVNWLGDAPARIVELRYLLNIYGGKVYFLGFDPNRVDYVLAEVSQDSSTWNVLVYTERASSLCHKVDPGDTGPPPSCWQGFTLHRVVGTDEMKSSIFGSWSLKKAACQR